MQYRLVCTVLTLILVLVFAVQNAAMVEIRLLFWQVEFPRSLLIFLMLLIGVAIGWVLKTVVHISRSPD